nr:hypothetical protein [Staphylococcus saccharolyticus]
MLLNNNNSLFILYIFYFLKFKTGENNDEKRLAFITLAILSTVVLILVTAKYPTGPHTITYDNPITIITAINSIVLMALPALILGIINHIVCRVLSAIMQMGAIMLWVIFAIVTYTVGDIPIALMALLTSILICISIIFTLAVNR